MNMVRGYDHLLGENWSIYDGGVVLGMFFGPEARARCERRLETIQHKPEPLQRTLEARARLLEQIRRSDRARRAEFNMERNGQRRRRTERRRGAR